ncbi:hypothetical protein [Halonotius pteroides]|uniref:hypothetical protein n=1 Tax=Halonotius pteroides TaxID=268735 RepID=UPI001402BBCB|nr:hypothetical protein [Halonotius pteroides]
MKEEFGAKHPGEIEMWRTIWDDYNLDYNTGIPEDYLPKAIRGALGLSKDKAIDAVNIGKEFDLLLEADPAETIDLQYDTESDTILRLVLPTERPDLYCDDVEQFADRDKWAEIWEMGGFDGSFLISKDDMVDFCINLLGIETEPQARAAIKVGEMSDSILRQDDGYILSGERAASYWLGLWESRGYVYEEAIPKKQIQVAIVARETVGGDEAHELIEDAVERGELYSPDDADDNELAINDPSSEDGPEIERKVGIDTDDDDTDDDDGESPQQATNGDTPDSTAPSESGEAETSPSENGSAGGVDADSPDGQTAATSSGDGDPPDATPDEGDTTSDESGSDGEDDDTLNTSPVEETPDTPDKTKEELLAENDDLRELEASIKADPPTGWRVKAAMAEAIEFFHNNLDNRIPENVEWNEQNPDAGYRKPETAREYFRDPKYDDDPAATRQINPRTDIIAETDGPNEFDISGIASHRLSEDTAGNESSNDSEQSDAADVLAEDKTETVTPYNIETRNNRGWSPKTIREKKLGWAPRDMDSLREHLVEEGFTDREMLATGLFNVTDDGKLLPFIQARYVLPYFDESGDPEFLISRSINTDIPGGRDGEGPDFHSESKYIKPKDRHLREPIYGTESIEKGEPLVITEGIADAITAHEFDIPCISPVTKQFKEQHFPHLESLILEHDVPQVFIIQDADPPASSVAQRYTEDYHDSYDSDADEPGKEPLTTAGPDSDITDALTVKQKGPGFEGALRTAMHLDAVGRRAGSQGRTDDADSQTIPDSKWNRDDADGDKSYTDSDDSPAASTEPVAASAATPDRAFETYLIELPRFGETKYDFDDYLSDGMGQLAPPAMWAMHNAGSGGDVETPVWIDKLLFNGSIDYPEIDSYDDLPDERRYVEQDLTQNEDGEGTNHPIRSAPAYHPDPRAEGTTLPLAMTILNFLPSIGPNNGALSPAVREGASSSTPGNFDNVPDDYTTESDNDLFNLNFKDVTSLGEGFRGKSPFGHTGESEDYFCVISEEIAYCHKRETAYTPGTAVLVAEGERRADNPGGSFSPKEKFVFWRHVRERGILDVKAPKDAMLYYARSEKIVSEDELVERDGPHGPFETMKAPKKCETLAAIGEEHSFEIHWDNYDSVITKPDTNGESGQPTTDDQPGDGESGSGGSSESTSGQSASDGEQSAAEQSGQSGASGESESATSSAGESSSDGDSTEATGVKITGDTSSNGTTNEADQPTDDDDDDSPPEAGDVPGGASSEDIFGSADGIGSDGESSTDSADEDDADNDRATKFHTYEEPDLDNPSIDVDIDAVAQFIEHHATTEEEDNQSLKTRTDTLISVFTEWAEMNDIKLDELDPSLPESNRKGNLTPILEDAFGIEKDRRRMDDDRPYVYHPISLDDDIQNIT